MKSKLCWIPFILFSLEAIAFLILENFSIINFQNNIISYFSLFSVLAMFIINIVFVAIDRKTSSVYLISRNIPAAVFSMLAAALVASKSSLNAILVFQSGTIDLFVLVVSIFGLLTAVCLVVIALAHIQGRNFLPSMSALFLTMPVWGGLMLISDFLSNRIVSVNVIDPLSIFVYSFMMIYLFKLSMVITTIDGKNPVKSMFLYGFPLAGLGFAVGTKCILSIIANGFDYSENIAQLACLAIAFYVVFFNIELTRFMKTKEEQIVKFDLDDYDETKGLYGGYGTNGDDIVVKSDKTSKDYDYDYSLVGMEADSFVRVPENTDSNGYSYGYDPENYDYGLVVAPEENSDDAIYIDKKTVDSFEEGVIKRKNKKTSEKRVADQNELNKSETPAVKPNEPVIVSHETSKDEETMAKIDSIIADINN